MDILADIDGLIVQAATERSHNYTASVLKKARAEIVFQRQTINNLVHAIEVRNEALENYENNRAPNDHTR